VAHQRVSLESVVSPISEIAVKSENHDLKPQEAAYPVPPIKLPSNKNRTHSKL
jgi:hypothetical protein